MDSTVKELRNARHQQQREKCELSQLVLSETISDLSRQAILGSKANLELLRAACASVGINYILITREYLVPDKIHYDAWPAVWRIPEKLGLRQGAGNSFQVQVIYGMADYFLEDVFNRVLVVDTGELVCDLSLVHDSARGWIEKAEYRR